MAATEDFSKTKSFRSLDKKLQKTFTSIKGDMKSMKEGQHQQGVKVAEVKQALKDAKTDLVTVDKFNLLKIKIGELNENMKKVWDTEKKLEDLDRRSISQTEYDKQAVTWNNEIKKLQTDLSGLDKDAATQEQMKELVTDVNDEFKKTKKAIEELRNIKDSITKQELEKRSKKLEKKTASVNEEVKKVAAEMKSKISTTQVESLVDDINKEFEEVRELVTEIKKDSSKFAVAFETERAFKDVNKEVGRLDRRVDGTEAKVMKKVNSATEKVDKRLTQRQDKADAALKEEVGKLDKKIEKSTKRLLVGLDNYAGSIEDAIEDFANRTKDKMAKISGHLETFEKDTKKEAKTFTTKKQIKTLITDINKEFDRTKDEIDKTIKQLKIARKTFASRDDLAAAFSGMGSTISTLQDRTKISLDELNERMKKDNNKIHTMLKESGKDLSAFEKETKAELKRRVLQEELEAELDAIQKEFENMNNDLIGVQNNFEKGLKAQALDAKATYAQQKHFDKLSSAVDRIEEIVQMQIEINKEKKKELKTKGKELKAYAREVRAQKKAVKRAEKESQVTVEVKKYEGETESRGSGNGWRFFGNYMVGVAFVLVGVAIIFFFTGLADWTSTLAIIAVACFVLGIIAKIVVAVKSGSDGEEEDYSRQIAKAHGMKPGKKKAGKSKKTSRAKKKPSKKAKKKSKSNAKKKPSKKAVKSKKSKKTKKKVSKPKKAKKKAKKKVKKRR